MSESDSDSFHSVEDDSDESLANRDANATDELQRLQLAPIELRAEQAVVTNMAAGKDAKSGILPSLVYGTPVLTTTKAVAHLAKTEDSSTSCTGWDEGGLAEDEIEDACLSGPEVRGNRVKPPVTSRQQNGLESQSNPAKPESSVKASDRPEGITSKVADVRDYLHYRALRKETPSTNDTGNTLHQSAAKDGWEDGWDVEEIADEHIEAALVQNASSGREAMVNSSRLDKSDDSKDARKSTETPKGSTTSREAELLTKTDRWSNWGSWGSSLLSTATSSVSTLTSEVGRGINNVFETVEQTLGVPKPEDLAVKQKTEKEVEHVQEESAVKSPVAESASDYDIKGLLSTITSKVQTSGVTLVATGLDALEGLGKKTMEVVSDKDPGLRQTKAALSGKLNQPNLSQVLREAKSTEHATGDKQSPCSSKTDDTVSFVKFFEEEQGTGSWEALEMLSSTCQQQIESPDMASARSLKRSFLDRLEALCQMTDDDDFPQKEDPSEFIRHNYKEMKIDLPEPHALLHLYGSSNEFLQANSAPEKLGVDIWRKSVHKHGIRTLAACTAKSLEQLRKMTEMVFLTSQRAKSDDLLLMRVGVMNSIICEFCGQLERIASAHATCLTLAQAKTGNKTQTSSEVTDMFVEASNSTRYIQDAFKLCLPVFQLAVLQDSQTPSARMGKKSDQ
ncbi:hypothetical protein RvY_09659 [Ramazzottius varieornatus]|uniref:Protein FAM114A2 n=1 Tax=Ramazzottius varieornatus TaxID=947166 RepID=A0A1D1VCI5_RAMVA|nr:hypothetical protein RvY_09659 [Ramazzottius varieornatus]